MRWILVATIAIAGCTSKRKAPADAAPAVAIGPAPMQAPGAAWEPWAAVSSAYVEPEGGFVVMMVADHLAQHGGSLYPEELPPLRDAVARNAAALRALVAASKASCALPPVSDVGIVGPDSMRVSRVIDLLGARMLLAIEDGDVEAAVDDAVVMLAATRALATCGGGALITAIAVRGAENAVAWVRPLVERADLGDDAARLRAALDEARLPAGLADAVVADELARTNGRAAPPIDEVVSRIRSDLHEVEHARKGLVDTLARPGP